MSSHHIVKEKQEPALYIEALGLFNEEFLGQLLEWSPTLLVNGNEYDKILSLGLKVDILVNGTQEEVSQEFTKVINGESSANEEALKYLIQENFPAVNIITDQFEIRNYSAFINQINLVVFTDEYKYYNVKNGFSVWKPAGSLFKIVSDEQVDFTNLQVNSSGDFETVMDGFVSFKFDGNTIFIAEPI